MYRSNPVSGHKRFSAALEVLWSRSCGCNLRLLVISLECLGCVCQGAARDWTRCVPNLFLAMRVNTLAPHRRDAKQRREDQGHLPPQLAQRCPSFRRRIQWSFAYVKILPEGKPKQSRLRPKVQANRWTPQLLRQPSYIECDLHLPPQLGNDDVGTFVYFISQWFFFHQWVKI